MSDVRHPIELNGYGSLQDAAKAVGALRYDAMAAFLGYLAKDLNNQAESDSKIGRNDLATEGFRASIKASELQLLANGMMDIARPHMILDLGQRPEIESIVANIMSSHSVKH